nr:MAG TPA: hypothetical protein [Bacteriophage sp.]
MRVISLILSPSRVWTRMVLITFVFVGRFSAAKKV